MDLLAHMMQTNFPPYSCRKNFWTLYIRPSRQIVLCRRCIPSATTGVKFRVARKGIHSLDGRDVTRHYSRARVQVTAPRSRERSTALNLWQELLFGKPPLLNLVFLGHNREAGISASRLWFARACYFYTREIVGTFMYTRMLWFLVCV